MGGSGDFLPAEPSLEDKLCQLLQIPPPKLCGSEVIQLKVVSGRSLRQTVKSVCFENTGHITGLASLELLRGCLLETDILRDVLLPFCDGTRADFAASFMRALARGPHSHFRQLFRHCLAGIGASQPARLKSRCCESCDPLQCIVEPTGTRAAALLYRRHHRSDLAAIERHKIAEQQRERRQKAFAVGSFEKHQVAQNGVERIE